MNPKGAKHPKGIGYIRLVCLAHKHTTENGGVNSIRQFVEIETSGRLNCSYCNNAAAFVSIPENLKIVNKYEIDYNNNTFIRGPDRLLHKT